MLPVTRRPPFGGSSGPTMRERSEELRREIALLQESAETLKNEAKTLIERSKELGKEIEKRTAPLAGDKPSREDAA